ELGACIEGAQNGRRLLARARVTLDRNQIAAHGYLHAKLVFEAHKMAAVTACEGGKRGVLFKFQRHHLARGVVSLIAAGGCHSEEPPCPCGMVELPQVGCRFNVPSPLAKADLYRLKARP